MRDPTTQVDSAKGNARWGVKRNEEPVEREDGTKGRERSKEKTIERERDKERVRVKES